MMIEDAGRGRKLNRAILAVCFCLAVASGVSGVQMSLSGSEKADLAALRTDLAGKCGPACPNQSSVKAWEAYRAGLEAGSRDLDDFLKDRDSGLDSFFPDFQAKSRNFERFKGIYLAKAKALYEKAKPVLAKDSSGVPLPADAVFGFEEWAGINPTEQEAVPAQKKYWIHDDAVDVLLGLSKKLSEAGRKALPELVSISAGEGAERGFYSLIPVVLTVRIHHADAPNLAALVMKSEGRKLLVRLTGLSIEKVENLEEEFVHKVAEGQESKFDAEEFAGRLHRPVLAKISYDVVDLK